VQSGIYNYEPLWGEWKIDELIGKGSYGEVYKIYKIVNGQRVEAAAKYVSIPKSEQDKELAYSKGLATDEESLRSFFATRANAFSKEIDLMMKLRGSENVVRYEAHLKEEKKDDVGWDIIIRMELLTALEKYLRANSFSQKNVIQLGIDICNAIESCQKEQIIHRDVKIENIFIDENGRFKLGDFGVSREAQGTTMGTITGTEDYMAPEIMKHEKYNNNVDIYSIGIVMYRLLNNNRIPFLPSDGPINDNDISLALTKRLEGVEKIPDPKFASGRLAEIIAKACAFDRHVRYSSPKEMADDLAAIMESAEDIEVLKPRVKKSSAKTDRTMSDVPISGSGGSNGSTISEFGSGGTGGGTMSDITGGSQSGEYSEYSSSGTMSDIGSVPPPAKKSKTPLYIGIASAVVVLILAIFLMIPKSIPVQTIEGIPEEAIQMVVKDTYEFELELFPENATSEVTYVSSDENVATIDENGVITAISVGQITVDIMVDNELYKSIEVNVAAEKVPVTDIQGIEPRATLEVGSSITLYAQVVPSNATEQKISYSSSNTGIATIGQDGVITGVSAGQTTITASVDGITKSMTLTVKAKPVKTPPTKPSGTSNGYTPPAKPKEPAVDNTPANNAGNSTNAGGGNTSTETKPSKQYEAGDLSAFPTE